MSRTDLFHGHIGGIDTLARALLVAAEMIESETLSGPVEKRYAGWSGDLGRSILEGAETLDSLEAKVASGELDPEPVSGEQELLENRVNRVIWSTGN
jgi:xylose isomerase